MTGGARDGVVSLSTPSQSWPNNISPAESRHHAYFKSPCCGSNPNIRPGPSIGLDVPMNTAHHESLSLQSPHQLLYQGFPAASVNQSSLGVPIHPSCYPPSQVAVHTHLGHNGVNISP